MITIRDLVEDGHNTGEIMRQLTKAMWLEVFSDKPLVYQMIDQLVRTERFKERQKARPIVDEPEHTARVPEHITQLENIRKADTKARRSLLNWPIYGGKLLRDCVYSDLARSVDQRQQLIHSNQANMEFERRVMMLLPTDDSQCVADLLEDDIEAAYSEARVSELVLQ